MDEAKIRLSAKEMELVTNADWILTKNGIIEKAKTLFAQLQEEMIDHVRSILPLLQVDVTRVPPKISKGENYNGLPYLMLDYPRLFEKENILAVRIMFWWGNFFSITLHLGGSYKMMYEKKCIESVTSFSSNEFYICINADEWEHHFDSSNYILFQNLKGDDLVRLIEEKPFLKLAKKYPLHQWDDVVSKLTADFRIITGVLAS